ncbi:MAG: LapA family protein [Ectothiorhodospiraceae bacterium]|jgi:putative membrane protein
MRRLIAFIAALAIVALGLSFAMLNADSVALNYYLGTATMPLSLWLVVALLLGAILGAVSTSGLLIRQRRELARLRRRVDVAQKELTELRKMPIRNAP